MNATISVYQSLGISVLPRYWDFTRNKPKSNCPNKEYTQKIILDKQTELQQRMLEFNSWKRQDRGEEKGRIQGNDSFTKERLFSEEYCQITGYRRFNCSKG